jgi:molecular chaperone DnaJ
MMDPYSVLGVAKTSSHDEIVKAYRSLATKYHPDKNPDSPREAAEKFKEISAAFELIGDEQKRQKFDFFGNSSPPSFSFRSRNSVDDVFDNIFSQFFGEQKSQLGGSKVRIKVALKDVYSGVTRKVKTEKRSLCDPCKGTGSSEWEPCGTCSSKGFVFVNNGPLRVQTSCSVCLGKGAVSKFKCETCQGNGYLIDLIKEVDVKIPAGIEDGTQIRLAGASADGNDLFVVVNVEKDELFAREDKFLVGHVDVSYPVLVMGGEVPYDVFGTKLSIKIPPRTKAGTRMRVKGQGMPLIHNPSTKGDLLVEIRLKMPSDVDKAHERLLVRLLKMDQS